MADLREALRRLRTAPGFTATAVVTLALGIGCTTAIFTLVHQVMLKSLPITRPDELWRIGDKNRCCNWGGYTQDRDGDFSLFSYEAYRSFRERAPEFADLAALQAGNTQLGVRKAGSQAPADTRNGQYVSGNFFRTLGVQPWAGRLFTDADDCKGAPLVAVMSYHVWQDKYGSDRSVLGGTYQINGHAFTIVGITPPGFFGAKLDGWGMPDLWLPITSEVALTPIPPARLDTPNGNYLDLLGRVRPGVQPTALEAKLKVIFHDWLASHVADMEPAERELWRQQTVHLAPGGAGVASMRDQYQEGLKLLLLAAGCVLLVACGNLANLMLARGLKERAQTSLRVALGAPRSRLVRKALVESTLLALIGGVLGIAVAFAATRLILSLAFVYTTQNTFVPVQATPSWPVLLFALVLSIATGVLFGIAPAWITSQVEPVEALRGANRTVGGGSGALARKGLVVAQAAMSLVLLSAAALLSQSLRNLQHQDFGFATAGHYLVSINPSLGDRKPETLEPLFRRIDERLMQIPGVRSVAPVLYAPMSGDSWNNGIRIAGRPEPPARAETGAGFARAMPGFFETVGARMLQGRGLAEQDTATTRKVAVVNQAFVRRFFKNQNPIGQHFGPNRLRDAGLYEVVGVVRDIRYMTWNVKEPIQPMYWLAETQTVHFAEPEQDSGERWSHFLQNIVIWAPGPMPGLAAQVRQAIAAVDPDLVVYSVDPYDQVLSNAFQQENMIATLTTMFGGLGLLLAAIGLYGVMAYTVQQRTPEIGVRIALGASRQNVIGMVLRSAFLQVAIGLAIGVPAAIGAGRLMTRQLFQVRPWDPAVLVGTTVVLCVAAFLASWIPATRAAAVEPMTALRNQ